MSFLNYEKLTPAYNEEPMKGNVERLVTCDIFHCLLAGSDSIAKSLQEQYENLPKDYIEWVKICDGGLLFDTVMLTTKGHDEELDLDFDTFEELNSQEVYEDYDLPEGYMIFAVRSYGDPICFSTEAGDDKVYLWDVEAGEFLEIWETFVDWITEEIDDALELIDEDVLEPLGIKLGGDDVE